VEFLTEIYDSGVGFSAMNTARCALSTIIMCGNTTIGAPPLISRFLKGVYNRRPPQTRHTEVWDVAIVLNSLKKLSPAKHLGIKSLTLKLVTLIALVSAQRAQTLHKLNVRNMEKSKSSVTFYFSSTLKQSRPGKSVAPVTLKKYAPDLRLCVVNYLNEYLKRT
jgi:hypothetical protein